MKRILMIMIPLLLCGAMLAYAQKPVDLGLPSRTLWANMNVGATTPEEYGDYYAWGEVKTKRHYGKYSRYQHYDEIIHKYNYLPIKSSVRDNILILTTDDDVAIKELGQDWRMPTDVEIEELLDTSICTFTSCVQNGTKGYIVKNKKIGVGDSIFLPCAGQKDYGNYRLFPGTTGYYWSSTLAGQDLMSKDLDSIPTKAPRSAKCLVFGNGVSEMMYVDRTIGCVIRPVYVGKRKRRK